MNITVDCHGVVRPNGAGYCWGAIISGQAGPGTTTASTIMEVTGICGTSSIDIGFTTPGGNANLVPLDGISYDFSCVIHIEDALAAQPWNALCHTR